MIWFMWQWAKRQGKQETWMEQVWNGVVERVFYCLNYSGWLVLQKHTTGTSELGMKSLSPSCAVLVNQSRFGEFQCKVGKGAWMHRKVLDPLLKMLRSTLICWRLKLPVMTVLVAEVSAQTGSRSVRTCWLCASRDFPKCLAAAPLGILKVFPPVLCELAQHSQLCGVVRASRQHIQTELTHQQAAKIASCPYGGGITFLNSLFWLVGVLVQELRWDLFRQLLNRYLRGELLLDCFPHRFFLRVNPCTFEHEYISDLLQQGSVQRLYLMRTELNASFHDVIIAW